MYLVAHRATDRGTREFFAQRLAEERSARRAEQAAYEAKLAEAEAEKLEAQERSRQMASEMRANGYRFNHTYRHIERRACRVFGLTPSEIKSDRRHQSIVIARQFIAYWACRLTTLSLPQLGRLMGGRDHTTCLHHKNKYPQKRAKMGRYLRPAR